MEVRENNRPQRDSNLSGGWGCDGPLVQIGYKSYGGIFLLTAIDGSLSLSGLLFPTFFSFSSIFIRLLRVVVNGFKQNLVLTLLAL